MEITEILRMPYLTTPKALWVKGWLSPIERNLFTTLYGTVWAEAKLDKEKRVWVQSGQWAGNWKELAVLSGYTIDQVRYAAQGLRGHKMICWVVKKDTKRANYLLITIIDYDEMCVAKNYFDSHRSTTGVPSQKGHNPLSKQPVTSNSKKDYQRSTTGVPVANNEDKTIDKYTLGNCPFCESEDGFMFNDEKCPKCGVVE